MTNLHVVEDPATELPVHRTLPAAPHTPTLLDGIIEWWQGPDWWVPLALLALVVVAAVTGIFVV